MSGARPSMRNRELARIHIAKSQLAMDDDVYRATVRAVSNQRTDSARDLDYAEREKLLEHFRRLGWKDGGGRLRRKHAARDKQAMIDKVSAMLSQSMRPWAYADGVAKRMFGVQKVDWLDHEQLRRLVTALEYDRRRRERKAAER